MNSNGRIFSIIWKIQREFPWENTIKKLLLTYPWIARSRKSVRFYISFLFSRWFENAGILICLTTSISGFHQIYKLNFFMPCLTMKWLNFCKNFLIDVQSPRANETNNLQDWKYKAGMVYILSKTLHNSKTKLGHSWTDTSLS